MKFFIRVKTNSLEQSIEEFGDHRYLVHLKSAPENNEANIELLKLMSKHLGVSSMKLKITSGLTNKDKVIEVVY